MFFCGKFFFIFSKVIPFLNSVTPGKLLYQALPNTRTLLPEQIASHPTVPVVVATKIEFSNNFLVLANDGTKTTDLILEIL